MEAVTNASAILSARAAATILLLGGPPILFLDINYIYMFYPWIISLYIYIYCKYQLADIYVFIYPGIYKSQ